jgi:hypothetical protein
LDLRRVVDSLSHRERGHQHVLLRHVRLQESFIWYLPGLFLCKVLCVT